MQDGLFVTTNDSGDTGRVFVVDRSGATVGRDALVGRRRPTSRRWRRPGPATSGSATSATTWRSRSDVTITRVPVGRGDRTVQPTSYRLTYPGGATDAETLVRDPVTGRLYVATKNVFGGALYAVPRQLSATGTNRLRPVGRVLPIATDGAFFPDGRHLVDARLRLGDGLRLAVAAAGRRRSTCPPSRRARGSRSGRTTRSTSRPRGCTLAVLATRVPAAVRRAMAPRRPSPSPARPRPRPAPTPGDRVASRRRSRPTTSGPGWSVGCSGSGVALVALLLSPASPRGRGRPSFG